MNEENFEQIWNLILANEGQPFVMKRGGEFMYEIINNKIQVVGNRPYPLSRQNFLNALPLYVPNQPKSIPSSIHGSSYVWGIYNGLYDQIQEF